MVLCPLISQNQLPLANGFLEDIENNEFQYWSHQANEGGEATYSIETNDLVSGSTKALKCEVHSLGANGWHVSSKSEYPFQVIAGQKYTVTFYAKVEGAESQGGRAYGAIVPTHRALHEMQRSRAVCSLHEHLSSYVLY